MVTKLKRFLFNNDFSAIKYCLGLLLVVIIFKNKFIALVSSILISPLLSTVEKSNVLIDICLLILSLSVILWFIYKALKGYQIAISLVSWIVTFSLLYFYFRFIYGGFCFVKFEIKLLSHVALTDTILTGIFSLVIYKVFFEIKKTREKNLQKKRENKSTGFYTDISTTIEVPENDIYKRYPYVVELKEKILATKTSNTSFAIAILGNWGSGKTTFINTLYKLFDKERDVLQFRFNSWAAKSTDKVIELFFSDFSSLLSKYDGSLKNEIIAYANLLIKSLDNSGLSLLKIFLQSSKPKTFQKQYESINNSIIRLNRKIIIYIDDVDRLYKNEIIEVLRLIRNTASFGNVYFITAFDKNYVNNAIKNALVSTSENYLDKIFQLEYYLPINRHEDALEKFFYGELEKFIDDESTEVANNMNKTNPGFMAVQEPKPHLSSYIYNMRDVKKLINIFNLNYQRIKGNIYLPDYISICMLRLRYPEIHNSLYYEQYKYLTSSAKNGIFEENTGLLFMRFVDETKTDIENTQLYNYFNNHENEFSFPKSELLKACKLVFEIFNAYHNQKTTPKRTLANNNFSITKISNFDRYFDLSLEGRLDENDFKFALNKDIETFKKQIFEWNKTRQVASDLQIRFEELVEFKNTDQFEKVILSIIYFTELPTAQDPNYVNSFNIENFLLKIRGEDVKNNQIIKKYYNGDESSYKKFIKSVFDYKVRVLGNNFLFQFAEYIWKRDSPNFILSKKEIEDFLRDAFLYNVEKADEFSESLMDYYAATVRIFADPKQTEIIKPINDGEIITEKFKNFIIEKGFIGFLKYNIFPYQGSEQLGYTLGKWPQVIFGSFDDFKTDLEKSKNIDEAKREFHNFCEQMDENGRVKKFDFNYLKKGSGDS